MSAGAGTTTYVATSGRGELWPPSETNAGGFRTRSSANPQPPNQAKIVPMTIPRKREGTLEISRRTPLPEIRPLPVVPITAIAGFGLTSSVDAYYVKYTIPRKVR